MGPEFEVPAEDRWRQTRAWFTKIRERLSFRSIIPASMTAANLLSSMASRGVARGSLDNTFRRTYGQSEGEETERTYVCGVVNELERHYRVEDIPELHPQGQ